jgi:uncharacterized protein YggE
MENPDTITIAVTRREEVNADKVDVHVTVKGSSLVTGNAALKKAKEVSQLVGALREMGLNEDDISLRGIYTESSTGILGRSTSASYQICIHCKNLESLAGILGVITAQKNARLDHLSWEYPEDRKIRNDWLPACLAEAKEKAAAIASGLGVALLGVHTFSEKWLDSEQAERPYLAELTGSVKFMARSRAAIDLGFPLSHSKRVEMQIEAQFRVAPFKATQNLE